MAIMIATTAPAKYMAIGSRSSTGWGVGVAVGGSTAKDATACES